MDTSGNYGYHQPSEEEEPTGEDCEIVDASSSFKWSVETFWFCPVSRNEKEEQKSSIVTFKV